MRSWVFAATVAACALIGCQGPEGPPTVDPAPVAVAEPSTTPATEPLPLDTVPPQAIAADLPTPAPADAATLDAARAAAEALLSAADGADERLVTGGMPDAVQLATVDLLRKIAQHTRRKRRIPFRVVHAPLWDELKAQAEAELADFDGSARASRLRAAASMIIEGGDVYDRAAGIALLRMALAARATAGAGLVADDGLRDALLARLPGADDDEERRFLYEVLGTAATDRLTPAFLAAAADDEHEPARRDALEALADCTRAARCAPAPGALRAIYRHTMPESVHSALVATGAALRMPAVGRWCAGEKRIMRSLACRDGLAAMRTAEGFERLLPYVEGRDADPITQSGRHYGFRDDFALLDRYADLPFATERYYALLDRVLARVARNGYATGFIVRRMATLADAGRAQALLQTHRPAYLARWGAAPTASNLKFLYAEFEHTAAALEARIAGRPVPARPDE